MDKGKARGNLLSSAGQISKGKKKKHKPKIKFSACEANCKQADFVKQREFYENKEDLVLHQGTFITNQDG